VLSDLEDEEEKLLLPEKSSIYLRLGTYSESLSSGSARMEKRLEKRKIQRMAALELDPSSFQIKNSVLPSPMPVVRKLKLPALEPSVFVLESFNAAEWVRIHRRKMMQLIPRRSMGSHRFTAISRDHRRSPQSIPNRRSGLNGNSNQHKKVFVGPKGHKALGPNVSESSNAGHQGPYAFATPIVGLRSMIVFQGILVAPPRSRSRSVISSPGRLSAMAGRQPPIPRGSNPPDPPPRAPA
jgi:hypothetical protein